MSPWQSGILASLSGHFSTQLESSSGKPSGRCSVLRLTPSSAYVCVASSDLCHSVSLSPLPSKDARTALYSVRRTGPLEDSLPNDGPLLPMWSVHRPAELRHPVEQLLELTSEAALGVLNLELRKNLTVDLPRDADMAVWRDLAGFVLRDTQGFVQRRLSKADFGASQAAEDVTVAPLKEPAALVKLDAGICKTPRREFIADLCACKAVSVHSATRSGRPVGAVGATDERILFLYAEEVGVAAALLAKALGGGAKTAVVPEEGWLAQEGREAGPSLRRYHTLHRGPRVHWAKVHVAAVGLNLY